MRKKVMFLLGFIVLSMFLFIQPIKAETETVGVHPTDDTAITCWWDGDDGFFIGGGNFTITILRLFIFRL